MIAAVIKKVAGAEPRDSGIEVIKQFTMTPAGCQKARDYLERNRIPHDPFRMTGMELVMIANRQILKKLGKIA